MLGGARDRSAFRRRSLYVLLGAAILLFALNLPAARMAERAGDAAATTVQNFRNLLLGPIRVGIQIGHLDAASHPEELSSLRVSTGGRAGGLQEVDVNGEVASALAARLQANGIEVDLLPATVPPRYRADLVVSLHADSSHDPTRRGYKSAVFRRHRNDRDPILKKHVDEAYLAGSGLPSDDRNVSGDMLDYYAFNERFEHSVARRTPAVIVEMGYLSHPQDRELLLHAEEVAGLLEAGIVDFLREVGRLEEG